MTQTAALGTLLLGLASAGCGREQLDLLVEAHREDPCLAFQTQADCQQNAALGCSFQPNIDGCQSTDPTCAPGLCRGGDPYVRRVERSFLLNGEPFRFVGVSSWALLQPEACANVKPANREAWMQGAYDGLVASHAKVARFFAFQTSAGPSGTDYTMFDAAVRDARRAGVRVQFILEHADGGCSQGMHRDTVWYSGGFRSPDGNYALSYRDYAEGLAQHFRDEPTVLGYALLQGLGGADPAAISSFVTEIGQLLHGVAPSQLISLDLGWSGDDGGAAYKAIELLPVVDFVDVDDYDFSEPPDPLDGTQVSVLGEIDKPAVVGEGAFKLDGSDATALQRRADKARGRMAEWKDAGFDGALFWAYEPGWVAVSEEFDARPADPMMQPTGVLASAPW